jgi:hypothetical protein
MALATQRGTLCVGSGGMLHAGERKGRDMHGRRYKLWAALHALQVGLLLHLPPGGQGNEVLERAVVRFKGGLYFVDEPETELQPLQVCVCGGSCSRGLLLCWWVAASTPARPCRAAWWRSP